SWRSARSSRGYSRRDVESAIVHIGYPKTGSTWLQREVFPRLGIRYGSAEPELGRLIGELAEGEVDAEAFRRARGEGPVLISNEGLVGSMWGPVENGLRNAERLHEVVPGARIAVLVRRQDEMLRSLYAQYVNMGGTRPPEGFLAEFHPEHLEYDRLLSRY